MKITTLLSILASSTILLSGCTVLLDNTQTSESKEKRSKVSTSTKTRGATQKKSSKDSRGNKKKDFTLNQGNYNVVWLDGDSCSQKGATLNLMLSEKKFAAFSGCNHINGSITNVAKESGKLGMEVELQTMRMCDDDESKFENEMKRKLDEVTDYEHINGTLVLKNKNKELFHLKEKN